jgi:hypothetical protein
MIGCASQWRAFNVRRVEERFIRADTQTALQFAD